MSSLLPLESSYDYAIMVHVLFEHKPVLLNEAMELPPAERQIRLREYHRQHVLSNRVGSTRLRLSYLRRVSAQALLQQGYHFGTN